MLYLAVDLLFSKSLLYAFVDKVVGCTMVVIIIGVREGILREGAEKICPENNNLPWK